MIKGKNNALLFKERERYNRSPVPVKAAPDQISDKSMSLSSRSRSCRKKSKTFVNSVEWKPTSRLKMLTKTEVGRLNDYHKGDGKPVYKYIKKDFNGAELSDEELDAEIRSIKST